MKDNSNKKYKVALIGNPNCGKTSLFNSLTGLHQHVANFPGVTVDKKIGKFNLSNKITIELIDFPGTYSLYPNSDDEKVVANILCNPKNIDFPDSILYVIDPFNLKREMLLLSQLNDIGLPVIVVLTMKDLAEKRGFEIDLPILENLINKKVIFFSNKTKENIPEIKEALKDIHESIDYSQKPYYKLNRKENKLVSLFSDKLEYNTDYQALLQIHHSKWLPFLPKELKEQIKEEKESINFKGISNKINETLKRFQAIGKIVGELEKNTKQKLNSTTDKIDNIITHRLIGPVIFFGLMLLMFQAMFSWSEIPMGWIENGFGFLTDFAKNNLPNAWYSSLIADGILPGLAGVLVFIPQIFILFLIIGVLEEIGYMSRVVYLFDEIMQKFGMNGRSMISLISGGACAVPAIMSTRTISNWKERLITIMVTPLISCAARIPVYSLLVIFAVPDINIGMFNARGLALMGLYLLGVIMTLISALVMKYIVKSEGRSFLIMELPEYKKPILKNLAIYIKEKVGAFILVAGKIILIVSIALWFLASYGPPNTMIKAENNALLLAKDKGLNKTETLNFIASEKLEHSYIGILGKTIEPAIRPLGFDWKIGIALITSFAAREVFVGTLATIYSIGSSEDEIKISDRMAKEVNIITGQKTYNRAVAWSLLIFYVFALQCMSTIAVVRKETNSWKWPIAQFLYMGFLAYFFSFLVYNFLN